jgi:hypothetical protein
MTPMLRCSALQPHIGSNVGMKDLAEVNMEFMSMTCETLVLTHPIAFPLLSHDKQKVSPPPLK